MSNSQTPPTTSGLAPSIARTIASDGNSTGRKVIHLLKIASYAASDVQSAQEVNHG